MRYSSAFLFGLMVMIAPSSGWGAKKRSSLGIHLPVDCVSAIAVPIATQRLLKIRPKYILEHSGSRVHDIEFLAPTVSNETTVLTTSVEGGVQVFQFEKGRPRSRLKSRLRLSEVHQKDGAVWSPHLSAIAPDRTFFLTQGGPTAPAYFFFDRKEDALYTETLPIPSFREPPWEGDSPLVALLKEDVAERWKTYRTKAGRAFTAKPEYRNGRYYGAGGASFSTEVAELYEVYLEAEKKLAVNESSSEVQEVLITKDSNSVLGFTKDGAVQIHRISRDRKYISSETDSVYLKLPREEYADTQYLEANLAQVALSPNGKWLAVGLWDGRIAQYRVSDILKGDSEVEAQQVYEHEPPLFRTSTTVSQWACTDLKYSPDGLKLIASLVHVTRKGHRAEHPYEFLRKVDRSELVVLGTRHFDMKQQIKEGLGDFVQGLLVSNADRFAALSSGSNNLLSLFSLSRGKPVAELKIERDPRRSYLNSSSETTDPIHSFTFSPNGKLLATGNDGGNLSLWDAKDGSLLMTAEVESDIQALTFSPDGSLLGLGAHSGVAHLYEVSELLRLPRKRPGEASLAAFVGLVE
jgi:WD40 repeat protein